MHTTESKLPNRSGVSESKTTKKVNQLQTIFQYLQHHTATASMIADGTGIYQKNICRYKADPTKAPKDEPKQLDLFSNE